MVKEDLLEAVKEILNESPDAKNTKIKLKLMGIGIKATDEEIEAAKSELNAPAKKTTKAKKSAEAKAEAKAEEGLVVGKKGNKKGAKKSTKKASSEAKPRRESVVFNKRPMISTLPMNFLGLVMPETLTDAQKQLKRVIGSKGSRIKNILKYCLNDAVFGKVFEPRASGIISEPEQKAMTSIWKMKKELLKEGRISIYTFGNETYFETALAVELDKMFRDIANIIRASINSKNKMRASLSDLDLELAFENKVFDQWFGVSENAYTAYKSILLSYIAENNNPETLPKRKSTSERMKRGDQYELVSETAPTDLIKKSGIPNIFTPINIKAILKEYVGGFKIERAVKDAEGNTVKITDANGKEKVKKESVASKASIPDQVCKYVAQLITIAIVNKISFLFTITNLATAKGQSTNLTLSRLIGAPIKGYGDVIAYSVIPMKLSSAWFRTKSKSELTSEQIADYTKAYYKQVFALPKVVNKIADVSGANVAQVRSK